MTWSPVNVTFAASRDDEESEHVRHRDVIAEVVSRALVRPALREVEAPITNRPTDRLPPTDGR